MSTMPGMWAGLTRYGCVLGAGAALGYEWKRRSLIETNIIVPKETRLNAQVLKYGSPMRLNAAPLCYSNHCLEYDGSRKVPIWVAEHISRDKVNGSVADRKRSKFKPDPALAQLIQANNDDFWNSGWSRGHMAPAGNNKHCQQSMDETFLLSNIVPQVIGTNEVAVPSHLFKVVLGTKANDQTKTANVPAPVLAAFIVPNKPIPREKALIDYRVSLEDIEKRLGYRLHPDLDRTSLGDLCELDGCQMTDYRKFQTFYIERGMKGARNQNELDRYWRRAKKLDLVTPSLEELKASKELEIDASERKKESAAAPGG